MDDLYKRQEAALEQEKVEYLYRRRLTTNRFLSEEELKSEAIESFRKRKEELIEVLDSDE